MFIDYNNINELIEYMICFISPKSVPYHQCRRDGIFIESSFAFKVVAICDMVIFECFLQIRLYLSAEHQSGRVYFTQKIINNHRFFA